MSGQLVNFFQRFYLIDCAEGTQMQLRKNRFKLSKIHHVFISHLHGDHFFGLVGLISSLNLFGRIKPFHIYSDPRIQEIIEMQLRVTETELHFEIVYHPLNFNEKTLIFEDKKLAVYSFPLEHRIPTCGFLFQEKASSPNIDKKAIKKYNLSLDDILEIRKGADFITSEGKTIPNALLVRLPQAPRSFAYCSDTRYFETLHQYFQNVELLYTECTFMKDLQKIAYDKFHLTTEDAAKIASEANAKKLLAGHFSARYKELEEMSDELLSFFDSAELVNENQTYFVRGNIEA